MSVFKTTDRVFFIILITFMSIVSFLIRRR
jgi:hypothetical protein